MKYAPFDIVMLGPAMGGKIFAIVAVEGNRADAPYLAVRLDRGPLDKQYRLRDEHILVKIGTLDPAALKVNPAEFDLPSPPDWELGQYFADWMARQASGEEERRRWSILAGLQPGDPVSIRRVTRRGEQVEVHRFRQVLPGGQKYHFAAVNANGTVYRWTLESLSLEEDEAQPPGSNPPGS